MALDTIGNLDCGDDWNKAIRIRQTLRRLRPLFDARDDVQVALGILGNKYAERLDGRPRTNERGEVLIDQERRAEYEAELRVVMAGEVEVAVEPLGRDDLAGVPLRGGMLAMLGDLFKEG